MTGGVSHCCLYYAVLVLVVEDGMREDQLIGFLELVVVMAKGTSQSKRSQGWMPPGFGSGWTRQAKSPGLRHA